MTEDLKRRVALFDQLEARTKCERPSPLILKLKIKPALYFKLRIAVALYMSKCIGDRAYETESELLEAFKKIPKIRNKNRNGCLLPKRELLLEYNMIYSAYGEVIRSFNFEGLLGAFYGIFTVRHKEEWAQSPWADVAKATGTYSTETPHSDAWMGESPFSMNTITPIFGDIANNNCAYYAPPDNFSDKWLKVLKFLDGAEYFSHYRQEPVAESNQLGYTYLSDISVIHNSNLRPNAGPRVSLDHLSFAKLDGSEVYHPTHPRLSYERFCNIGLEEILTFRNSIDDPITLENADPHKSWGIMKLSRETVLK